MQTLRQIGGSLLLALFSAALVIGGISLALAESYIPEIPTPTETLALIPPVIMNTPTSQVVVFITETAPAPSATIPPPTSCPPPAGWIAITIQPGDDLVTLSLRHQSTPDELSQKNCLFSTNLPTGSILYVPPLPTQTVVACGRPPGWIAYTVRPGNTLYSLSHAYGVTVAQLQFANCIPSYRYTLSVGQTLWVPNVAVTRTPLATATATLTPVSIIFPTLTWTPSPTQTATDVPTATLFSTDVPTATQTATVASPTTPPTATATITAFPTATATLPTP